MKSQQQQRPIYENWVLLRVRAPCILRQKEIICESHHRDKKKNDEGEQKAPHPPLDANKVKIAKKHVGSDMYAKQVCVLSCSKLIPPPPLPLVV